MVWSFRRTPFLIAGPCMIEPGDMLLTIAEALARLEQELGIPVCLKASFDKANRSRLTGHRGPGLDDGLRTLERRGRPAAFQWSRIFMNRDRQRLSLRSLT